MSESQPPSPALATTPTTVECRPRRATRKGTHRTVAFLAVVFSTVAMTACLLSFPLVFHYVQTLQAAVQVEVEYCKSRSRDMWREMVCQSKTVRNLFNYTQGGRGIGHAGHGGG